MDLTAASSRRSRKEASKNRSTPRSTALTGERTVRRLRLSKALIVPETTTVYDACRRMAARRVDALLLTDSNALLSGILTDKDIATRVVAQELDLNNTPVSKVMTRNPIFVLSDSLAVEALQKMVQGKFRHLPVVENGEVIAILDIAKCLYDAIARMERAAEQRKAIAAAVEGVAKQWGTSVSGSKTFIETLQQKLLKPSLSTIISENSKFVTVLPSETVLMATKKMLESRMSSAVTTVGSKTVGILTSKDILMRVIAQGLPPESTLMEKVMTLNPECVTIDTPIVEALHAMHDGKFLHLPVVDREGIVVDVVDVLQISHAAVDWVGSIAGIDNERSSVMDKFWDSADQLEPAPSSDDDSQTRRALTGEHTVKHLRLSKALTVPETTTVYEACRRMAARRVDTLLLTDSIGLLCGILTDKDIATRVVACELNLDNTPVSVVMTRNPVFVLSDTLAVEALQKMVQGKFRRLPVVENGEVIAILDIAKCLYDEIVLMERPAEKGAVEGVEKHRGTSVSGLNTFINKLPERMFRSSLSAIISENSKLVTVLPSETVLTATKKMLESRMSAAITTVGTKTVGILTSKDILMRVIAQGLPPESTLVEKVMTPNPECATIDTPIVEAMQAMHDGKFLHLPVVDREGIVVGVVDVLHIFLAAVASKSWDLPMIAPPA